MSEWIETPETVPMDEAIARALAGAEYGEHPIGAVVVQDTEDGPWIVSAAGNFTHGGMDSTAHAEVQALRAAQHFLGRRRLTTERLEVTCEPCPMCTGAAIACRIGSIAFGASIPDVEGAKAANPNIRWRLSKERATEIVAKSDRPNTPVTQVDDMTTRQRCLDLLGVAITPIPSSPEGGAGARTDTLRIDCIERLDDVHSRLTFRFEGIDYDLRVPMNPAEFFGWWLPGYAARTQRCGVTSCREIIWPHQPTVVYGQGELAHLRSDCCIDPIGAGQTYNDKGEIVPIENMRLVPA